MSIATSESKSLNTVSEDAANAIKTMRLKKKYAFVTLKVEGSVIELDKTGDAGTSADAFFRCLPTTSCRYALYEHKSMTDDGRTVYKLFFILWTPSLAAPEGKFILTTQKEALRAAVGQVPELIVNNVNDLKAGIGLQVVESDSSSESDDE